MLPIHITEKQLELIQSYKLNADEFNQLIAEMTNQDQHKPNLQNQNCYAFLQIQFQQYLIDIRESSLCYIVNEQMGKHDNKQDFFQMLSKRGYYYRIKLYWLDYLENNAAYMLVFKAKNLQNNLILLYLSQISDIYNETLQIDKNKLTTTQNIQTHRRYEKDQENETQKIVKKVKLNSPLYEVTGDGKIIQIL